MQYKCPKCGSEHIGVRNYAKKTCCVVGMLAGALGGAEIGAASGMVIGPIRIVIGSISGGIIGALTGAMSGGTIGAKLGMVIDDHLLCNYECLDCRHTFCDSDVIPTANEGEYYRHAQTSPHNPGFYGEEPHSPELE